MGIKTSQDGQVKACKQNKTEKVRQAWAIRSFDSRRSRLASPWKADANTPHESASHRTPTPPSRARTIVDRTTQETLEAFDRRLAELPKIRKDNVRAVEILVGFSPSEAARLSKAEQDRYFADAKAWLVKLFGGPKNLLNTTIHADEHTSRHMTMFVMPIEAIKDEQTGKELGEKLNCKHWLGGARRLSLLQTRFHNDVAGRYGLERGILGSKAKHQEVDRFYAGSAGSHGGCITARTRSSET